MRYTIALALLIIGSISATTQGAAPIATKKVVTLSGSISCWDPACDFHPSNNAEVLLLGNIDKEALENYEYQFYFKNNNIASPKLGWSGSNVKSDNCFYERKVTIKVAGNPKIVEGEASYEVFLELVSVEETTDKFKKASKDMQPSNCK